MDEIKIKENNFKYIVNNPEDPFITKKNFFKKKFNKEKNYLKNQENNLKIIDIEKILKEINENHNYKADKSKNISFNNKLKCSINNHNFSNKENLIKEINIINSYQIPKTSIDKEKSIKRMNENKIINLNFEEDLLNKDQRLTENNNIKKYYKISNKLAKTNNNSIHFNSLIKENISNLQDFKNIKSKDSNKFKTKYTTVGTENISSKGIHKINNHLANNSEKNIVTDSKLVLDNMYSFEIDNKKDEGMKRRKKILII